MITKSDQNQKSKGHPLLTGHPRHVLFVVIEKMEKSVVILVSNNGLTISMKSFNQHATQVKIVSADKVAVSTKKMTSIQIVVSHVLSTCLSESNIPLEFVHT